MNTVADMCMDPSDGSMISVDLDANCRLGSMIPPNPV